MEKNNDDRLFLLDAYALIFRAYYALAYLKTNQSPSQQKAFVNSKGIFTGAAYGFTNTLLYLLEKENPSHIAVVFDAAVKTDREVEHSFYKANRQKTPEDISVSIPIIKDILKGFKIPILELDGFEADDVIGTIAKQKEKEGHIIYMVTPDKDFAQLVSENIFIWKPGRQGSNEEIIGLEDIKKKWEVENPEQVIDILGMWGDSVDNIPGIPGVGEKTAKKLVQEYGSVESVIEHADELKGKLKANVVEFAEQAMISKKLATIILDAPISVSDDDLLREDPDEKVLTKLFAELEFRTLGKRIFGDQFSVNVKQPAQMDMFGSGNGKGTKTTTANNIHEAVKKGGTIKNTDHQYHIVDDASKRANLISQLKRQSAFALSTKINGSDPLNAAIVGIAFAYKAHEGFWVPCPQDAEECKIIITEFKELLEDPKILKIGHNIKFDMHVLRLLGIHLKHVEDTMVSHYLAAPEMKHTMAFLAESYLGYTPISEESLVGKGRGKINLREADDQKTADFVAEEADLILQLKPKIEAMVAERDVRKLLQDMEVPLIPILEDMEFEGVALDVEFLKSYSNELKNQAASLEKEVMDLAGQTFNLDSPKQLGEILFNILKIPYKGKKTKTGAFSTGEEVLTAIADEYPIAAKALDYREIKKLVSTYVDALPDLINPRTNRLHTTFEQAIAATGRLSSNSPNLQNIPVRTERGRHIRKAFIPRDKDHVLLSADYSQIELRIIASLSGDENMKGAFIQGLDIHTATAAKVFNVPLEMVDSDMRRKAKAVNFGLIYGQGAFGLAQQLKISRKEAKEIIDNYFEKYSGIRDYMESNKEFARTHGYIMTVLGRKRYLPDINSRNFTVKSFAERNAINAPIQGSAADMIKVAMIRIAKEFQKRKFKSKMTLQVHDELVFDALKEEVDAIKPVVVENMQQAMNLEVPVVVEVGVGDNWLEAH